MPVTHCTGVSEGVTAPGSVGEKVLGTPRAALCCGGFGGGSHGEPRVGSRNAPGSSRCPPPSRLCQCQALASPTCHSRMPRKPCRAGRLRWERWNPCAPCRVTSTRGSWDRDIPILMLSGRVGCSAPVPGRAPGWNVGGHRHPGPPARLQGSRVPGARAGVGKPGWEKPPRRASAPRSAP